MNVRPRDPLAEAVTEAVTVIHARTKPLHDAIVASVPLLCDAYMMEIAKLFHAARDQRQVR